VTSDRVGILTVALAKVVAWLGAGAVAASVSGCAAGALASFAPMGVAAAQAVTISAAESASGGGQDAKDEQADRCEDLIKATPGVEEVRKNKEGTIEVRQWRLTERDGNPTWLFVRTKQAPEDGWQPDSKGITSLKFTPTLPDMLVPGEPQFLAYAPMTATTPAEGDKMAAMTSAFGAGDGVFEYQGRQYSFVLVKKLPCYKPSP
jgi:hypothetical protein